MRIDLPEQKKLVFEARYPIRWGDMDALGHVNNTVYFRYLESARVDWFRHIGFKLQAQGAGPVIVNAFCNFYRQFEYPGEVLLKMYASDPARATFETWATMEKAEAPGQVCAAGGATVIWVDFATQKATALPDWLRALVSADTPSAPAVR